MVENKGELKVNSQVLISFTLERYKNEVFCDVVLTHEGDILLGLVGNMIGRSPTIDC